MFNVYVLLSDLNGSIYVGIAKDVPIRLEEHNRGKSQYTKAHRPFKLMHVEGPSETLVARKREKYLKSTAGKNYLIKSGFL